MREARRSRLSLVVRTNPLRYRDRELSELSEFQVDDEPRHSDHVKKASGVIESQ